MAVSLAMRIRIVWIQMRMASVAICSGWKNPLARMVKYPSKYLIVGRSVGTLGVYG